VSDTPKRFEEWEKVDCNDCSHYWDSSCDGASKGSRVGCNSYSATRKVVIPERLNALEERVDGLQRGYAVIFILLVVLFTIVGWYFG
jgi:hypothetical protein